MKKLLLSAVAVLGLLPGLTSTASAELIPENRSGWIIKGCSQRPASEAITTDGDLTRVLDGRLDTYWHSYWSGHDALNHYFYIDRGENLADVELSAIGYTPRQGDKQGNGYVTACDIYMLDSVDGLNVMGGTGDGSGGVANQGHESLTTFIEGKIPTAQGSFSYGYGDESKPECMVEFETPTSGRYILFVATETIGSLEGGMFANCAEFNAYSDGVLYVHLPGSGLESVAALENGKEYLIYDTHSDRYGFHYAKSDDTSKVYKTQKNLESTDDLDLSYVWIAEQSEDNWKFVNKGTGKYISTVSHWLSGTAGVSDNGGLFAVTYNETDKVFTLKNAGDDNYWSGDRTYLAGDGESGKHNFKFIEAAPIYTTYVSTTFTYPSVGEMEATVTIEMPHGTAVDTEGLIPVPNFFNMTGIAEGDKIATFANNKFTVQGEWSLPFELNSAYRIDIRQKSTKHGSSNFLYEASTKKILTRNTTNQDAFVAERLFYLAGKGLDQTTGNLIVTLHSVAADASLGFQVAATDNAVGAFSSTPTEFRVVTNTHDSSEKDGEGISLQHPESNITHVNDLASGLGVWSNAGSQADLGSFLRFFSIDADLEALESNATADLVRNNPTPDNLRLWFAYADDVPTIIENGNNFVELGISSSEGENAWTTFTNEFAADTDVFTDEKYNELIAAYDALVATSANIPGEVYVKFAHPVVVGDLMCVRYGNGAYVGRYGSDVNGNKITWKLEPANGGFLLYNAYSAKYLKMPVADNQNSALVEKVDASVFVFDVHNPVTAQYGIKYAGEGVVSNREYLHSNTGHNIVRWEKGDNSSWYLSASNEATATAEDAQGSADDLADALQHLSTIDQTNVGSAFGQYSISEEYTQALAAAQAVASEAPATEKRAAAVALRNAHANGRILNGPVAGKFYRFENKQVDNRYLSAKVENNKLAMLDDSDGNALENVFYYDGTHLVAWQDGKVLGSFSSSDNVNTWQTVLLSQNNYVGSVIFAGVSEGVFTIQASAGRYLHGSGTTANCGSSPNSTDYQWAISEVKWLPIVGSEKELTSIYTPVAINLKDEVSAYNATISGANVPTTKLQGSVIPANTPVLVKFTDKVERDAVNNKVYLELAYDAVETYADEAVNSPLSGGIYAVALEEGKSYFTTQEHEIPLSGSEEGATEVVVDFLPFAATSSCVPGFVTYIETASEDAPELFTITGDGSTTGIEEIVAETEKVQGIYDLQGRRLSAPVKGINIINGKKVLVK